jgi:hypothetical protein
VGAGIHNDDNVVELDQPLMIGAGVGYKALENLLLAADIEYRGYGGGQVAVRDSLRLVPGGTDEEFFTEYDPYWNNAWEFRVGGEYLWETGSRMFPTVPVRAGFGYIQIPTPNVDGGGFEIQNDQIVFVPTTSQASMTRWSLGAGVRWAQIHLDMAWVNTSFERNNDFWAQESTVDNSALTFTFTGYF